MAHISEFTNDSRYINGKSKNVADALYRTGVNQCCSARPTVDFCELGITQKSEKGLQHLPLLAHGFGF